MRQALRVAEGQHRLVVAQEVVKDRAQNLGITGLPTQTGRVDPAFGHQRGQTIIIGHDPGQGLKGDHVCGFLLQLRCAERLRPRSVATK